MGWNERLTAATVAAVFLGGIAVGYQARISEWNTRRGARRLIQRLERERGL